MGNMLELEAGGMVQGPSSLRLEPLTPRQLEVLALLSEGLSNKLIARRLNIASATVKIHVANILHVLRVSSRLQAVVVARRRGLCERAPAASSAREETQSEHRALDLLRLILGDEGAARLLAANSGSPMVAASV